MESGICAAHVLLLVGRCISDRRGRNRIAIGQYPAALGAHSQETDSVPAHLGRGQKQTEREANIWERVFMVLLLTGKSAQGEIDVLSGESNIVLLSGAAKTSLLNVRSWFRGSLAVSTSRHAQQTPAHGRHKLCEGE